MDMRSKNAREITSRESVTHRAASETLSQTDGPECDVQYHPAGYAPLGFSVQLTGRLKEVVQQHGVSQLVVLIGCWSILLQRWSGLQDVSVNFRTASQQHPGTRGLIGPSECASTLEVTVSKNLTVEELLSDISVDLGQPSCRPAQLMHEQLGRSDGSGVDSHLIAVPLRSSEALAAAEMPWLPQIEASEATIAEARTQAELSLLVEETPNGVAAAIEYASDLHDHRAISRMAACYEELLEQMTLDTQARVAQLPILPAAERELVLQVFNDTAADYPGNRLIHPIFEEQGRRTPDAVALAYEGEELSYSELNARANQLAHLLREHGIGPGERVAICVDRGLAMVTSVLGVLKAGGAYVPLDPAYPAERLAYMLGDALPRVLLIQDRLRPILPYSQAESIVLDSDWSAIAAQPFTDIDAAALGLRPDHLAYIIYTSGSTGLPKGVMIEHRHVVNLWQGLERVYAHSAPCRRVGLNASLSFDASVQQLVQLLSGRAVVVVPQNVRWDASRLIGFLQDHRIEAIDCTPSQLRSWVSAGLLDAGRHGLRVVLVGGEAIDAQLWAQLASSRQIDFYNVYGPTECTVDATVAALKDSSERPHVGRPMVNRRIYVLDQNREPVPAGFVGELYIGGEGVARGYWNRSELTEQRFSPDPFSVDPQARMYRTGDLGRWRSDGVIEHLGRNDDQVKVRGYRIELGEIEAQLAKHELVDDSVVLVREDLPGEKQLVAYLVPRHASDRGALMPSAEVLRAHLRQMLPEYMVPSAFVCLDKFPLTPSGKLNRQILPVPQLEAYTSRPYEAPQGETEELLAFIWRTLLRMEHVGRWDNFFELGGHSLLIVKMMERLREAGLAVDARKVFENPTLSDLAGTLTSAATAHCEIPASMIPLDCEMITPQMLSLVELEPEHIQRIVQSVPGGAANIQDIYPLAPLQEGILFHHKLDEHGGDTYVLPILMSLSSRRTLERFIEALQWVIDRHEVLRTAVLFEQLPRPVQVVQRHALLEVKELALDPLRDPVDQLKERMRPEHQKLDLRRAPMIRVQIAPDSSTERWFAILQLHHVASDHESVETMLAEVRAYLEERAQDLPAAVPYRSHVARALDPERIIGAEAFFRAKLGDVDEPTAPFGLLDVRGEGARIDRADQAIEPTLARRIRSQARRLGVSAATLFHAAWALVVSRTSGRDDVVFGTVLLGRLQGSAGTQCMLGMLINTLPLRLRLDRISARELVEQTQRELVELLGHEQASLAAAQRCSGVGASLPLFGTLINYLHSSIDIETGQPSVAAGIRVLASHEWTSYPIALSIYDQGEGFMLMAKTDQRIDPRRITRYISTSIEALVEALDHAPEAPALGLRVFPPEEERQVIEVFNATSVAYPGEKLVHELFEEQAARTPERAAVVYQGRSLSYIELNQRANQLARVLRDKGVGPDQLVGICVERGLELVIGLLAVLKAGGAYVPLDPDYPAERLAYMLQDAAPKVVLTQRQLVAELSVSAADIVTLDGDWGQINNEDSSNPDCRACGLKPHHLAYVIYTSGSTGQPKGVMIEHRNVQSLWQGLEQVYPRTQACQRIAVNASFNFDASVKQFIQLLSGRTLFPVPPETRADPSLMLGFLEQERIDGIDCTPSQLKAWISAGLLEPGRKRPSVVLVGGELIDAELWQALAQCSGTDFYNVYGPTESTVDTTFACIKDHATSLPHIGRPMQNRRVYILDARRQPVPVGVTGELYIGGAGIARGYWNRPELTGERFSADLFADDPNARMYRSGDMGRWRPDGTIDYMGRNDQQVKIRGFRIELGEIEAQLLKNEQVKQAAVVAHVDGTGERRLVAYVAADFSKLKAEHEDGSRTASTEVVAQWNRVHDETYSSGAVGPSFIGWNSSYTGEPIPESEMQEWLGCTIERIQSLRPSRVLEIGCGVGLLLQHVAPGSKTYVATDFSAAAIDQLRQWINGRDDLQHVEVLHRSATDVAGLKPGSFDLVVLNSVVQYFPDIEYLMTVLQQVIPLLSPGGKIFVGDIRHLGALPMFHGAVQLNRAAATVPVKQLKGRIARALAQEKELVIDPQFFEALPGHLQRITAADVQLKRGRATNELTRYRYDAVLHTERAAIARTSCTHLEWFEAVGSMAELDCALEERHWPAICLASIPNARLLREREALELVATSDEAQSASAIRRKLSELKVDGVEPDDLWVCGQARGYDVHVRWSPGAVPSCFDAYLVDRAAATTIQSIAPATVLERRPWAEYANSPLESGFKQQLVPRLREYLKEKLPDYMIPAGWVVLKSLPLTPSGKIDRRALPAPQARGEELGEYVAPQSDIERSLADIWAQVLQVDQVGVQDDFFEIGGHSLLAMQAIVRIRSTLSIDLPMRLLFEHPTIRQLSIRIEELREVRLREEIESGAGEVQELLEEIAAMPESKVRELMRELRQT